MPITLSIITMCTIPNPIRNAIKFMFFCLSKKYKITPNIGYLTKVIRKNIFDFFLEKKTFVDSSNILKSIMLIKQPKNNPNVILKGYNK
jgi:hypothetical protein